MTVLKCSSCQKLSYFEAKVITVQDYNGELVSIQCGSCKAVAGIIDTNPVVLIQRLAKELGKNIG